MGGKDVLLHSTYKIQGKELLKDKAKVNTLLHKNGAKLL